MSPPAAGEGGWLTRLPGGEYAYPLLDAALLGPAALLVLADRAHILVGILLALFWLAHLPKPAASRFEPALGGALLALTGLTVLLGITQPRGPASGPAIWGILLHVAAVRAGADWPWRERRSLVLGAGLGLVAAGLVALAFVGTNWKLNSSLLPARLASAIRQMPHLVASVQTSHGARPGLPSNEVAGVIAPLVLLPLAWMLFRRARWSLAPALLLLAGMLGVELMAGSRSALAGIVVGALCLLGLRSRRLAALATAVVLAVAVLQVPSLVREMTPRRTPSLGHQSSLDARRDLWQHGLTYASRHPLTGIGVNRFAEEYLADPSNQHVADEDPASHAHDFYLQLVLDLGAAGLLLFLAVLGFAAAGFRAGWRAFPVGDRWLPAALASGIVAALVFGLTDEVAPGAKAGLLFWLYLGLLIGVGNGLIPHTRSSTRARAPVTPPGREG